MKLKERLAATHAIHSKIYPRYKTYKAFHLATENLSHWLSAHQDPNTDVILVGHSMGGLLAEEVVLLVCRDCYIMLPLSDY
jgi:alpha-beta hydrolase superfamily lysophospholipase